MSFGTNEKDFSVKEQMVISVANICDTRLRKGKEYGQFHIVLDT